MEVGGEAAGGRGGVGGRNVEVVKRAKRIMTGVAEARWLFSLCVCMSVFVVRNNGHPSSRIVGYFAYVRTRLGVDYVLRTSIRQRCDGVLSRDMWAWGLRNAPCASLEQLGRWTDVWTTDTMRSLGGCGMDCCGIGALRCVPGMSFFGSDTIIDVAGGLGG